MGSGFVRYVQAVGGQLQIIAVFGDDLFIPRGRHPRRVTMQFASLEGDFTEISPGDRIVHAGAKVARMRMRRTVTES